jgi:hypothetical protein
VTGTSTLQLSLTDMARLAQVQRPVVSMWRKRPVDGRPFPRPVAEYEGTERFDAFEVVDYLAATGRGNATVAREDVAAHATLALPTQLPDEAVFEGLTALLALGVTSGDSLSDLTAGEIVDLATTHDHEDTLLLREVVRLAPELDTFAAHADDLADASYSPAAAFELLLDQRIRRARTPLSAVALRPEAATLVGRVAVELVSDAGWEAPLFVDVSESSGDLLLATSRTYAAVLAPSLATLALDTPLARLVRRRLLVHDVHRLDLSADLNDADGDLDLGDAVRDGVVHVLQLPDAAHPSSTDVDVLDAVSRLVDQLADDSRVVVLGPARALTDPPRTAENDRARDAILRSGRLRAAIRLPEGLLVHSPRHALALWVLGPAHQDLAISDRWTVVGLVPSKVLTASAIDDVVGDVVASLARPDQVEHHSYRFARRVVTSTLIPGRKPLVDRAARTGGTTHMISLGDAVRAGQCRIVSGHRVAAEHVGTGGRRVVGVPELLGERRLGERTVDRLEFADQYPAARYTEAGDIVFCTSPRVGMWLDHEGGSVVLSPARIIRLVTDPDKGPPPLVPQVIAADIDMARRREAPAKDWRRWQLRLVSREEREALLHRLAEINAERRQLRTRLEALDAETARVIDNSTGPREEGR